MRISGISAPRIQGQYTRLLFNMTCTLLYQRQFTLKTKGPNIKRIETEYVKKNTRKDRNERDTANAAVHSASSPIEPIIPHLTTSELNIRVP